MNLFSDTGSTPVASTKINQSIFNQLFFIATLSIIQDGYEKRVSKMRIKNWRNAVLSGIISAAATILACIIFTYVLDILLRGKNFAGKEFTSVINGISFIAVQITGGIISALIPLLILRYSSSKFLFAYLPVSVSIYLALCLAIQFGLSQWILYELHANTKGSIFYNSPLNSFDYLCYCVFTFPIGATVGTMLSIVINEIRNRKSL